MATKQTKKKPPLGSGARFKAIVKEAEESGAENPEAVAAAMGRKAHGQKKMTEWATAGKRRRAKKG